MAYTGKQNSAACSLIDAALMYCRLETARSLSDNSGRSGQIFIPPHLASGGVRDRALLLFYPGIVIERRRQEYIDGLLAVSRDGKGIGRVGFFLRANQEICGETLKWAERFFAFLEECKQQIAGKDWWQNFIKPAEHLFRQPVVSIPQAAAVSEVKYPAVRHIVEHWMPAQILQKLSSSRSKLFFASDIIHLASVSR